MPMTHSEKVKAMYRHLPQLGLRPYSFAPPFYRLLWRHGIEIAPPHFTPFIPLALGSGIFFGAGMVLMLVAVNSVYPGFLNFSNFALWKSGIWGGTAFGLIMAMIIRFQANRRHLPLWGNYVGI